MRISKQIARSLALALGTSVLPVFAQPNLKNLLTTEEWKASGLDRLQPAEIAVIESALGRLQRPTSLAPTPAAAVPVTPPAQLPAKDSAHVATAPEAPPSPGTIRSQAPTQISQNAPAAAAVVSPPATEVPPALPSESAIEDSRGWLNRFGLPDFKDADWRKLPPLRAKVLSWESANRFNLHNGQAWEGTDPIPDELVGRTIEIHARPNNRFTLIVDGKNTKVRVVRVR